MSTLDTEGLASFVFLLGIDLVKRPLLKEIIPLLSIASIATVVFAPILRQGARLRRLFASTLNSRVLVQVSVGGCALELALLYDYHLSKFNKRVEYFIGLV